MKKILLSLLCLLIWGCQSITPEQKESEQKVSDLSIIEWKEMMFGCGNDKGYYHISMSDELTRLAYIDYQTRKEVFLCQKPECQHKDETCTALLPRGMGLSHIVVFKNHIYLIDPTNGGMIYGGEGNQLSGPKIYQMDLDGQNRKEFYQLEEGSQFVSGHIVFDDQYLYIPIDKRKDVEIKKNSQMSVTLERYLYRIDLKTGQGEKVLNMYEKDILGIEGRNLILKSYVYKEDPKKYLDEKNYKKYEQVLMSGKIQFEIYNLDTKSSQVIQPDMNDYDQYFQGKVYYMKKNQVMAFDLKEKKSQVLVSLPERNKTSYYISDIVASNLIIEAFDSVKEVNTNTYKISVDNPERQELHHFKRAPKESVDILSQTDDSMLVIYDREGHNEKTWAGTIQYETDKEYYGLISKKDFLNNQKNYQKIDMLESQ